MVFMIIFGQFRKFSNWSDLDRRKKSVKIMGLKTTFERKLIAQKKPNRLQIELSSLS